MKKEEILRIFAKTACIPAERIFLRKMQKKDAVDMYDYARRPLVTKYLLWHPHPDLQYTKRYLAYVEACYRMGKFFDLAIIDRENDRMIGTCGFTRFDFQNNAAEIGYVLHPDYWNRGIATEAAKALMQYGFEKLALHRIEARYMVENQASRRVMEKCGMHFEGVLHEAMLIKDRYEDIGLCAKIKEN
jgi:ribosomal-protein-alanine N-acetyltransferase